jgi:gluconate 2-dehydrogenase gamma chain
MSDGTVDRRTALALLGAGVLASRLDAARFFSPAEHELVDVLTEMIIPADEHSPGARAAGVGAYIDLVIAGSSSEEQTKCRSELAGFEEFARQQCGKPFLQADATARARVLDRLAGQAPHAASPAGRFFGRVREMTIYGYYTSEIGLLKELGYKGNQVLAVFPGCKSKEG